MTSSFDVHTTAVHLDGIGPIRASEATDQFWADRSHPALREGQILSVFRYTQTWDYHERHPEGDELAVVLEGHIDVLLDVGRGEVAEPLLPGSGCVIPAGVWHRVRVHEPSIVLFITPAAARTEHRSLSESVDATAPNPGPV